MAGEASFDRSAAAALWELTDALDADDALAALRDAGLLEEGADGRCTQHPLLRAYARALLDAAGETAAAQARHFAHYAALHGDYDTNNDEDRFPLIEADWPNLLAALEWGWGAEPEAAVDWAWALNYFMQMRLSLSERHALLQTAHAAAERTGSSRGQANTLQALGDLSLREDELSAARTYYERALPLYEAIGARLGQANTLKALGDLSLREAELSAARTYYERALLMGKQIGDLTSQLNSLYRLSQIEHTQGDQTAACAYARDLLALAESHPFFKTHPVVANWRAEFAAWGCSS
jgi:tetratricopeptide (TPR) repeat protein